MEFKADKVVMRRSDEERQPSLGVLYLSLHQLRLRVNWFCVRVVSWCAFTDELNENQTTKPHEPGSTRPKDCEANGPPYVGLLKRNHSAKRLKHNDAFVPPNPKPLVSAYSTTASRASFGM